MDRISSTLQFDQILTEHPQIIVKFFTDWCVDCRRVDKGFDDFAKANQAKAKFVELNAESVRAVSDRYDVKGIPSFLFFRNGELVDRLYSKDAKTLKQVLEFSEKALSDQGEGERRGS
jgi:thioredoxin 1